MSDNPYAAPQADILTNPASSESEAIRRSHLKTESTVKTAGTLYYLGSLALVGFGIAAFRDKEIYERIFLPPVVLIVLGLAQGFVGYGLRRLRSWARVPTFILSGLGLLGFPLGTLINIVILINVGSKKGRTVMSPEYQQVIAETPHVGHKTSKVTKIILIVLLLVLALMVFSALTSRV